MGSNRAPRLAERGDGSATAGGGVVVLEDVGWRTYERLLRTFAGRHDVRLTYDRGRLEIMSPLLEHEDDRRFLGRLVIVSTEELRRQRD